MCGSAPDVMLDISDLYLAVHLTARASAILFATALLVPVLFHRTQQHSQGLYGVFIVAQTAHFGCVIWLANEMGGRNMFPGGKSIEEVGGWPIVFGICSLFYALAVVRLITSSMEMGTRWRPQTASRMATAMIGGMFLSVYVPLIPQSSWYAALAALLTIGITADLLREKIHQWRCVRDTAAGNAV
ncbi:MAG: hypothetical protein QM706_04685 [Nitrospira sp.]